VGVSRLTLAEAKLLLRLVARALLFELQDRTGLVEGLKREIGNLKARGNFYGFQVYPLVRAYFWVKGNVTAQCQKLFLYTRVSRGERAGSSFSRLLLYEKKELLVTKGRKGLVE